MHLGVITKIECKLLDPLVQITDSSAFYMQMLLLSRHCLNVGQTCPSINETVPRILSVRESAYSQFSKNLYAITTAEIPFGRVHNLILGYVI